MRHLYYLIYLRVYKTSTAILVELSSKRDHGEEVERCAQNVGLLITWGSPLSITTWVTSRPGSAAYKNKSYFRT